MSDMRYARVCETARRTEMNGYKVTWSQGYEVTRLQCYSVTTGTGAQPRPLAELQNRFQIPKCKEMTKTAAIPAFCSPVEGGAALPPR